MPADRPIAAPSQLPLFTLGDICTMRRLAAGPFAWRFLIGWRGHGDALQYLERRGMVRISFDWHRRRPVAELTHGGALWLAADAVAAQDHRAGSGRRRV